MAKEELMHVFETLADLHPASYNPRDITPAARKGLEKSLDEFGDISGITWNAKTGNLVSGHQRVAALVKKGATVDIEEGAVLCEGEVYPVRIVYWELDKEKRANIAANSKHLAGDFNSGLEELLAELSLDADSYKALRFDKLIDLEKFADYSDLDAQVAELDPLADVTIFVIVPKKHKEAVQKWMLNGRDTRKATAGQLGIGILSRMELLVAAPVPESETGGAGGD